MAKLPGWMRVIETKDKGSTVVIAIRWCHPHVWGICYQQCKREVIELGRNPNHVTMRWLMVKTVIKTVWEQSKHSWTF